MENIKTVVKETSASNDVSKEQLLNCKSKEFDVFINTLASVVEKHGSEILKELECVV